MSNRRRSDWRKIVMPEELYKCPLIKVSVGRWYVLDLWNRWSQRWVSIAIHVAKNKYSNCPRLVPIISTFIRGQNKYGKMSMSVALTPFFSFSFLFFFVFWESGGLKSIDPTDLSFYLTEGLRIFRWKTVFQNSKYLVILLKRLVMLNDKTLFPALNFGGHAPGLCSRAWLDHLSQALKFHSWFPQFLQGKYSCPDKCISGECRGRVFTPQRSSAHTETIDWQTVKIQEIMVDDQREAGRIPRTIECECTHGLGRTDSPNFYLTSSLNVLDEWNSKTFLISEFHLTPLNQIRLSGILGKYWFIPFYP